MFRAVDERVHVCVCEKSPGISFGPFKCMRQPDTIVAGGGASCQRAVMRDACTSSRAAVHEHSPLVYVRKKGGGFCLRDE